MTMAKTNKNTTIKEAPVNPVDWLAIGRELAANTSCLEIHFRSFGFRKKVKSDQILNEKDHDKDQQVSASAIVASKSLIERTMLAEITKLDNKLRHWIRGRAVDSSIVGDGMYLIPAELVTQIDDEIVKVTKEREGLVEAFIDQYPTLKAQQRAKLGRLYKESDYPTIDEIRRAFAVETRYVTLSVPEQLAVFSEQIFKREREKMERQWQHAFGEIREGMRAGFADLVNHMVDRLGADESGKPKIFRDSLVGNLADFLETFNARNLTKDADLQALVERARQLLKGVRPDSIRERKSLRSNLAESFGQIKAQLDTMVTDKNRAFKFGQGV